MYGNKLWEELEKMGKLIGFILIVVVIGIGVMYWQNSDKTADAPQQTIEQSADELVQSTKQLIDRVSDEVETKMEEVTSEPAATEDAATEADNAASDEAVSDNKMEETQIDTQSDTGADEPTQEQ